MPELPTGIPPAPGDPQCAEVGSVVADLKAHGDFRLVDVHADVRERVQNDRAQFLLYLRGLHRERLVAALGFHLEGLCALEGFAQVLGGMLRDNAEILREYGAALYRADAEYLLKAVYHLVDVGFLRGSNVDG